MKKIIFFLCVIISVSFLGCKNTNKNSNTTNTNDTINTTNTDNTKVEKNIILEKEYKTKVNESLKDLYARIDFDYDKAFKKQDIDFLGFNTKDMSVAEDIFISSKEKYNKIKDNDFKDINDKVENILSMYQKIIDGRRLVYKNKNDGEFMHEGYGINVVVPIRDIKKALDEFKNIKDDITTTVNQK